MTDQGRPDDNRPIEFIRVVDNDRDCVLADDVVVRVTRLASNRSRVAVTIGGERGRQLRRQRAARRKRGRAGDDLLDLGEIGFGGEDGL